MSKASKCAVLTVLYALCALAFLGGELAVMELLAHRRLAYHLIGPTSGWECDFCSAANLRALASATACYAWGLVRVGRGKW